MTKSKTWEVYDAAWSKAVRFHTEDDARVFYLKLKVIGKSNAALLRWTEDHYGTKRWVLLEAMGLERRLYMPSNPECHACDEPVASEEELMAQIFGEQADG